MILELSARRFRPNGKRRDLPVDPSTLSNWQQRWLEEGGAAVRIHDAGDFYSEQYLLAWVAIARAVPDVLFYAYTHEVSLCKRHAGGFPPNMAVLYSTGGLEDHLIDSAVDRHADVFPSLAEMEAAGYLSQKENDLLAILLPTTRVGIVANNIAAYNKRINGRRFSELVPVALRMP